MSATAEPAVVASEGPPATAAEGDATWPWGVLWRDIARGGLAGLVVGIVVGGIGGRVVMRLAALLVPAADGLPTENGNRIGDITVGGSLALILFVGLFVGATAGTVWVVVRPWLPGSGIVRALATAVVAISVGTFALIEGDNLDFLILRHDPLVVGSLVGLVGLAGLAVSFLDEWLDRRLPAAPSLQSTAAWTYATIGILGMFLVPLVVGAYLGGDMRPAGVGLVVVGLATLAWWALRFRGATRPPGSLDIVARVALAATVLAGLAIQAPEIAGALGLS